MRLISNELYLCFMASRLCAYLFEQILTVALNGNSLYNQSAFHLPFKL